MGVKAEVFVYVVSRFESVLGADSFRPLPGAGQLRSALRQSPQVSRRKAGTSPQYGRAHLFGNRHGLHLVLEGSIVPATVRRHSLPPEETPCASAIGHPY